MARLLSVRGSSLVQLPAPEITNLRVLDQHWTFGPTTVADASTLPLHGIHSDALEIVARFAVTGQEPVNSSFGVALRVGGGNTAAAVVGFRPSTHSIGVGRLANVSTAHFTWKADIAPQPVKGVVQLRIFLDRSVIEIYTGGAALTARSNLAAGADASAAQGVAIWAEGGADANLVSLEAWGMGSMWAKVT